MTQFKRTLIIWASLMGLFLLFIVWVNRHGDRAVKAVEVRAKLTRGLELEASNMLEEAIAEYEGALKINDRALRPRVLLVRAYTQVGRLDDALSRAEEAVEVTAGRNRVPALLLLSGVCREMSLWDQARSALETAIQMSPRCAEARYGMARVAEAMRMYPRMVDELRKAARLGARGSSPEYKAARERRQQEIERYQKELNERGESAEIYYKLAVEYKELGLWDDAVAAFEKAASLGQKQGHASFWLGVQAEVEGNTADAVGHYRTAVEACPNHLDALIGLERSLLLQEATQKPTEASAWYRLGLLHVRFRNWEEASRSFSKAVEIDPGLADARFRLGLSLEMLRKTADARAEYTETVKLLPTHLPALEALQKLGARG
jgi:tetratricopeptide (TPR) repeat protein